MLQTNKWDRYIPQFHKFRYFQINDKVAEFARRLADEEICRVNGENDVHVGPQTLRLPAARTMIGLLGDVYIVADVSEGFHVLIMQDKRGGWGSVGVIRPGDQYLLTETKSLNWTDGERGGRMIVLSFVLSLINEPRICSKEPAPTRQQRGGPLRGMGFAVNAWTKVSWDLSKEMRQKISRDPNFHPRALHWCRSHWRLAKQHYNGAVQRPDALRPEDREKWWQRIPDRWKGHPAFGVVKSIHAPYISGDDIARRASVPPVTRLAPALPRKKPVDSIEQVLTYRP